MKKLLFVAAIASMALVSCDSKEKEEVVLDPTGTIEMSVKDIPWDGASVEANVVTEFEWSITIADTTVFQVVPSSGKGNTKVVATLAKNTTNQAIPVSAKITFVNKDKTFEIPVLFAIPAPSLTFGGETYSVAYMKDGKYWMSENLRYVPEGMTVYEPSKDNADAKIWYPAVIEQDAASGKFVAAASKDEAVIAAQGLLYSPEYVLGGAYNDSVDFADAVYTTAICPEGWHIPTAQEWIDLVGACADKSKNNENAPYYSADLSGASLEELNKDGLNLLPYPYVNNTSYLCSVLNVDSTRVYNGMNSMSYYLSATGTVGKNIQGYAAMITNNKTKTSVNVAKANLNTGISVRYVKD